VVAVSSSIPPKRHIYVADRLNHRIVRFDDMSGAGWITLGHLEK